MARNSAGRCRRSLHWVTHCSARPAWPSARARRTRSRIRERQDVRAADDETGLAEGGTMALSTMNAEPYAFEFDPRSTALIVIDMQRDFVEPGGFGEALG